MSTRIYKRIIAEMGDRLGENKSAGSREAIQASETVTAELMERRFDDLDLLVLYLDGILKAVIRAAWELETKEGEEKLEHLSRWLERDYPTAAVILREGQPGSHGQQPLRNPAEDPTRDELDERGHGAPIAGGSIDRDGEELPEDPRL